MSCLMKRHFVLRELGFWDEKQAVVNHTNKLERKPVEMNRNLLENKMKLNGPFSYFSYRYNKKYETKLKHANFCDSLAASHIEQN